jgi:Clp amino terminal domain, pathogenicity island component
MIGLDVADLMVIASEVLDCDTDTALAQADIGAAEAALAQAGAAGRAGSDGEARLHPAEAADAAIALTDALLRRPPFPAHHEQIAVAAGLQFLAVNGWQAYLDVPRAAVIVIERLAAGELTPPQAASWLAAHLFPDPSQPAGQGHPLAATPAKFPVTMITRAIRRRYRRRRHMVPFLISVRPGGGSITTMVTGPLAFTGRASEALGLARRESSRLGGPRDPEHILLGLMDAGDGLAVKALERLGVRPDAVREQVEQLTDQETGYPPGPVAPQTRRVWHAVADEAFARGDDYIGTEHFLFALFCDDDNAAAQILTGLGAGEREVRAAVAELLAESGRERSA